MDNKYLLKLSLLILFLTVALIQPVNGAILDDWANSSAYKPNPILFLHGFAQGSFSSWNYIKSELNKYFDDYSNSLTFLEAINFDDPNGSIDTYDPRMTNPQGNNKGWADKVNDEVNELLNLDKYGSLSLNKLNLVCHSMGGLAVREYITNYKYSNSKDNIDKLITIGTPHAGTPFANIEKIKDGINSEYKYVWKLPQNERWNLNVSISMNESALQLIVGKFKIDPEGEAVKDMAVGSGFLRILNSRPQVTDFKNYAIYGEVWSSLNALFGAYYPNEPFTCGDSLVPRDSQIGIDIMTNYPDTAPTKVWSFDGITKIPIDHFTELNYRETPQKILSFLDSTPPEFKITSPDPTKTTEIHETSIHIQGRVYKEYLPADSQLLINVTRDDGYTLPLQTSLLKPSDLWIPNNPDSPVAEFDEVINFPGKGTYRISCQVKNPAGLTSDIKDVWVEIIALEGTNIIVHCHNPEGKEIASIQGMSQNCVEIYDRNTLIGYGAHNAETHNKPIKISTGTHTIKAKFNGMVKEEIVTTEPNKTTIITFTFERTELDLSLMMSQGVTAEESKSGYRGTGVSGLHNWHDNLQIQSPDREVGMGVAADGKYYGGVEYEYDTYMHAWVNITSSLVAISVDGFFEASIYEQHGYNDKCWLEYIKEVCVNGIYGDINIPIQNFNSWFVQGIKLAGQTARCWIRGENNSYIYVASQPGGWELPLGYYLSTSPTNVVYFEIYLYGIYKEVEKNGGTGINYLSANISNSKSFPSTMKVSSVPYDLLGTAI